MLGPFGLERDVLHERSPQRDVQHLDPTAHAEHREAAVERTLDELALEYVASRLRVGQVLARLLPVAAWVDVTATAEKDAVAGVERILQVAVDPREPEPDAARERERPLEAHTRVIAEVVQAEREADDRFPPIPRHETLISEGLVPH